MANSQQNLEIAGYLQELLQERDLISAAIHAGLGQPQSVNLVGAVQYLNRPLEMLYELRRSIDIDIQAARTGTTMTRTFPKYWRNGSGGLTGPIL